MNPLSEVGRITPCAPFCAGQGIAVAAVGAQRTARLTFRLMESFLSLLRMHRGYELILRRERLRRALIVSSEDGHGRSGLDGVSPYLQVHGKAPFPFTHALGP